MPFDKLIPGSTPIPFMPELVPDSLLIHRGVMSNDLQTYYYTVSDKNFTKFDCMVVTRQGDSWSNPSEAFFNSDYSDHGMSFSPDGKTLVFSSTRPVGDSIPNTWHLWMSRKLEGKWSVPSYLEIPNLKSKLLSHPAIAPDGTLYFHASNTDYSDMHIYSSSLKNGKYQDAEKILFKNLNTAGFCTPYVSASGEQLIFASIGKSLELYICGKNGQEWSVPRKLSDEINTKGQGNPYLTPDGRFLFFASEDHDQSGWNINVVSTRAFLSPE